MPIFLCITLEQRLPSARGVNTPDTLQTDAHTSTDYPRRTCTPRVIHLILKALREMHASLLQRLPVLPWKYMGAASGSQEGSTAVTLRA